MEKISKSKNFTEEYCCSVVKVGVLESVENSDNLAKTFINGESIVVNKKEIHEGDILLYISNESQIMPWFLHANNLYDDYTLNANKSIVEEAIKEDADFLKSDEFKRMKGFFTSNGRVRMIKLRGCPSFGILFKPESLDRALVSMGLEALEINWEEKVGEDFDLVYNMQFVKVYVPPFKENTHHTGTGPNSKKARWDRFNRVIPGQFKFHYDTALLKKHLNDFNIDTIIDVSVKLHGTSFICGNVLVNYPKRFFKIRKWLNKYLHLNISETEEKYGMLCSSRKVIMNEWGDSDHPEGVFRKENDVYTEYGKILAPYIPNNAVVYGEICGYKTGSSTMIQKNYDYGCKEGENFLMIYRVVQKIGGIKRELSVHDVIKFTMALLERMKQASDPDASRIRCIADYLLIHGPIYLWTDKVEKLPEVLAEECHIEEREHCIHNVPREGIVVRIADDTIPRAYKLKSVKFMEKEKANIDKGEVDMESQDNYAENQ